ncbi:hypothetical protein [Microbacterium sp. SSM24]|uniref:hypothetical protein n=1 Tax=Microbacterium sp. SSM24 TaxID=2991714 RepID=UPI002227C969|nr:hypothetical protein [Microbacterium sp. SSM24]MCW3492432.1 hypothetical protein [Microbacterium sp. SSM24]
MEQDRGPLSLTVEGNNGMLIEVQGERFEVERRTEPDGGIVYDFTWVNGPGASSYGFTVGSTSSAQNDFSRAFIEKEAGLFVRAFFSDDGIGPSDFPEFVEARRKRGPQT